MAITKFSGNFDNDSIIKNWEMRQNERFKYVQIILNFIFIYMLLFFLII